MSRLAAEVRSAFKQDTDMTFHAVEALNYLTAVIQESLRIYPPFVTSLSRVVPQGGAVINGHFVPGNVCIRTPLKSAAPTNHNQTIVACHHYASYHSESNFALPGKFMPERWLSSDPVFDNDKKDVLQPFSLGPRVCLGKQCVLLHLLSFQGYTTFLNTELSFLLSLANCEIRLILCKLLYHFDLTLRPESMNWPDQEVYFLWDKPPLMVTLKDRFPKTGLASSQKPTALFPA